ncbi:nucleotidyl transferase AbiEii/AbiGii toxin family protein [Chloroflexota bacterium]
MINRAALNERVREWGLREDVVEKDYVIGWLLWGIGSNPVLSASWAFKGGTCLKKCYLETYRFSEDLDFTVLPEGPLNPDEVMPLIQEVLDRIYDQSGVDFRVRPPVFRLRPGNTSAEGRIYYRGPRNAPGAASIKLDLTAGEQIVRPTVLNQISHPYPDKLPDPATVRCYSFEELFAEKLRAMGERSRPRDLYDIINLFRRQDFRPHAELIRSVYIQKCETKGVEVFSFDSIEKSPYRGELESEWENMLGHQLPALPPFDNFWQEVPQLFDWLDGKLAPEELPTISLGKGEEAEWTPPPTVWVWGEKVPLETVRFAAANYLCVELGYGGSKRLIEPYSLRRTKDGNLLLYAVKTMTSELRAYRVDRIENIKVTNTPYKPRYPVEFTSSGTLIAPPTQRVDTSYISPRPLKSGVIHVIECSYCGRRFKRSTYNTRLRPHKDKNGMYDCPGRFGYEVDRHYT